MSRLAILNGVLDVTDDANAREPDWSSYAPLRGIALTVTALKEVLRLHRAYWMSDTGGRRAYLGGAYLRGVDLIGAILGGAILGGADLRGADLSGADLGGCKLPSPTVVLLAAWGTLAADLTLDLMRYDASCHPDPEAFDRWAAGGGCPYDGVMVERAAVFSERRDLWSPGPSKRPYDLMVAVLAEKCPAWTEEQKAGFSKRFEKVSA